MYTILDTNISSVTSAGISPASFISEVIAVEKSYIATCDTSDIVPSANVNVTSLLDLITTSFTLLSSIIFLISSALIVVLPSDTSTTVLVVLDSGVDGFSSAGVSVVLSDGLLVVSPFELSVVLSLDDLAVNVSLSATHSTL